MDKIKFDYKLSKIEELLNNNKYYDAIDLCKEIEDDESSIDKHSFNNGIEYYLYLVTYNLNVAKESLDYRKFYNLYGTNLMLIGKYLEAREYFKKSLEIDPFDALVRFKFTETFKLTNDLEAYFIESNDAINYCYRAIDFQRFYRNISEYYFRHENFVEALYMMLFAKYVYEDNIDIIYPELSRIYDCLGKELDPSIDAIINFMNNKNIWLPTDQIDKLNYIYNKIYESDAITSYDILKVLYELTYDPKYKEMLDSIDNIIEKGK